MEKKEGKNLIKFNCALHGISNNTNIMQHRQFHFRRFLYIIILQMVFFSMSQLAFFAGK